MTTSQLYELLEKNVAEITEAMQHLYGLGQFSIEVASDASMRAGGAATLLSGIGHILVTKGVCTADELTRAVKGAEAAGALSQALAHLGTPTKKEEESEYPEDAVIFGGGT